MTAPRTPGQVVDPVVHVELPQSDRAAGYARRAARDTLLQWRLPALVDTVVLAVSELVTNAVRHGRPQVWMTLSHSRRRIGVHVHDDNPRGLEAGQRCRVAAGAESGRGLNIVSALALAVSVEQVPGDGKVVTACFDIAPEPDRQMPED